MKINHEDRGSRIEDRESPYAWRFDHRSSIIATLLILAFSALPLQAQPALSDHATEIKRLFAEERWDEIVRIAEDGAERSADINYYYGTALARLGRWDEARKAFQIGLSQQPGDKRFSLELAGVSFRKKNYAEAAGHLRRALRLDPMDTYAIDLLAAVYFLQGNVEAAINYWNRVSKPEIEEVRTEPGRWTAPSPSPPPRSSTFVSCKPRKRECAG